MSIRSRVSRLTACMLLCVSLVGCGGDGGDDTPVSPPSDALVLQVPASLQQTPVWCWAASAEMVMRYYGLPSANPASYQCGLIAAWFFGTACQNDCSLCITAIGPMSNMHRLITGYGAFMQSTLGIPSRSLSAQLEFRPLSTSEIATEISAGRPIVIGIAPGGGFALPNASAHIAVAIGYDYRGTVPYVIVNDPFPFQFPPYSAYPNPYVAAGGVELATGRYAVPHAALVQQLGWANTIFAIR